MANFKRVVVKTKSGTEYTYETDLEVKVGDRVVVPTADFLRSVYGASQEFEVTSLESGYSGPCKRVIRVIKKDDNG